MSRFAVLMRPAVAFFTLGLLALLLHAQTAAAQLAVVATTSDVASLVSAVGGDLVRVQSIIPPAGDPEAFEPRVSDFAKLAHADLIVRVGLGYDFWIDRLTDRLQRPELQQGGPRSIDASAGIPLLEVGGLNPLVPDDGHGHGIANPHYWLDPVNAETITANIAAGIIRLDPNARDTIEANRNRFLAKLHERLAVWSRQLSPYRGTALLAYHNGWPYFARRFQLDMVGFIETKEGVPPSAAHLTALLAQAQRRGARAILQTPYEPTRFSDMLSARTGVPVVTLAASVGSLPQAADYLGMMDYNVDVLTHALASSAR
ncbi:zinc/manganese transport system substrate-binding protein/zinc transport system substrate-binding protein [Paraburkholderia sp. BL6669N2]|uniref:metal ABC transporter substrate-binding protein n=1 Tax=Paraburkholderia sp. BL6669N2 TaxID=1938807 RepID=UPI000E2693B6|nr:metal ABC transporter substrate-binding protein [Paraburkholderia sp. BL6669N2]REG49123.1 zinc/manganese transport system substrate-binding protein/zinc transport system substrate-binding protein [Paraburkholderia sp. BL6669N2]